VGWQNAHSLHHPARLLLPVPVGSALEHSPGFAGVCLCWVLASPPSTQTFGFPPLHHAQRVCSTNHHQLTSHLLDAVFCTTTSSSSSRGFCYCPNPNHSPYRNRPVHRAASSVNSTPFDPPAICTDIIDTSIPPSTSQPRNYHLRQSAIESYHPFLTRPSSCATAPAFAALARPWLHRHLVLRNYFMGRIDTSSTRLSTGISLNRYP
jgi:hypothetical protein